MESHLLQMRGLKPLDQHVLLEYTKSHLLQMRGLKHRKRIPFVCYIWSHLLQMRGLKQYSAVVIGFKKRRIFYRCVD